MQTNKNKSALVMSGYAMREKGITKRVRNINISAIKEMMHLSLSYPDAISLAQGTPDFLTPQHIRDAVKRELDTNPAIGKYAPFTGLPILKTAIAKALKRKRGIDANPDRELYVTLGAMEAVASAIWTVAEAGDEVILFSPCFPSHKVQIGLAEAQVVYSVLDESRGWEFNLEDFKSKISPRTRAVVLCSPSNPTGTIFRERDVRAIAELAIQYDFWIITDEPYDFLVYTGAKFFSAAEIPEIKDRLIACFSLSKEYAMTGFRIGYAYAEEGVINQMLKLHDSFVVTAPTVSQYAALAALEGDQKIVESFVKEFSKRRDLMCKRLDRLSGLFSYHKPEGAYYMFPKIEILVDDYELCLEILEKARVVVVPGSAFGSSGLGHLRLCFAMSEDSINTAFDRLEKWWEGRF